MESTEEEVGEGLALGAAHWTSSGGGRCRVSPAVGGQVDAGETGIWGLPACRRNCKPYAWRSAAGERVDGEADIKGWEAKENLALRTEEPGSRKKRPALEARGRGISARRPWPAGPRSQASAKGRPSTDHWVCSKKTDQTQGPHGVARAEETGKPSSRGSLKEGFLEEGMSEQKPEGCTPVSQVKGGGPGEGTA